MRHKCLVLHCTLLLIYGSFLAYLGFSPFSSPEWVSWGFTHISSQFDKLLHLIAFTILTILVYSLFVNNSHSSLFRMVNGGGGVNETRSRRMGTRQPVEEVELKQSIINGMSLYATILIVVGAAVFSEIVQGFLPNHTFDIWDILSNLMGCLLGIFLYHFLVFPLSVSMGWIGDKRGMESRIPVPYGSAGLFGGGRESVFSLRDFNKSNRVDLITTKNDFEGRSDVCDDEEEMFIVFP